MTVCTLAPTDAAIRPLGGLATPTQRLERSVSASERAARHLDRMSRTGGGRGSSAANAKNSTGSGIGYDAVAASRLRRRLRLRAGVAASPDSHQPTRTSLQMLETLRHHDRNSSLFSGMLDRAAENIIGSKYTIKPTTGDEDLDKQIKDYILLRMEKQHFSANGLVNFVDGMGLTLRAIWNDGDILHSKRSDGSVLTFEADQIVTPRDNKKNIVRGVLKGDLGEHLGYYVSQRPIVSDNGVMRTPVLLDGHNTEFIHAANAIVPAYRKRFNQTRGMSFLAAVLSIFDRADAWIDNESLAAEITSLPSLKLTDKNRDEFGDPTFQLSSNDDIAKVVNEVTEAWERMRAGTMLNLAGTGLDLGAFISDRPNANFDKFLTAVCRLIGVAVGYPLELLLLDYSKSTFTASQMGWDQTRRSFERWQMWADGDIVAPWYRWQIARGIASGEVPADPRAFKYRSVWPVWTPPDQLKNAKAWQIKMKCKAASRKDWIRTQGGDPDEVDREIEDDKLFPYKTAVVAAEATPPGENDD